MASFSKLKRCMDLSQRDVDASMDSREAVKEVLDAMAAVARPDEGASRVLLVFATMATGVCDWLDGELRVELVEADDVTVIECMTDLGGGFRERVFAPLVMKAPMEEFRRATSVAEMIVPLVVKSSRGRRLVLVAEPQAEAPSLIAPAVEIGKDNLFNANARSARPPRSMSSGHMRAVRTVAVPAPARLPDLVKSDGDDELAPARIVTEPEHDVAHDVATTEPAPSSRTMIPMDGLGAPPPPPIVNAKRIDTAAPRSKRGRKSSSAPRRKST